MNKEQSINQIVELLLQLANILKELDGVNPNNIWQLHEANEVPESFKPAKIIMDRILELVLRMNSEMLSTATIYTMLLYSTVSIQLQTQQSEVEFRKRTYENVESVINYKAFRDVDTLVVSLDVGKEKFIFGPVVFYPFGDTLKSSAWWGQARMTVSDKMGEFIHCFVRANVPGDLHRSITNGSKLASVALLLLRGIGFPFTAEEKHQFGIINEYPLWKPVPFRVGVPKESASIDYHSKYVTDVGPTIHPYQLFEEILSNINSTRLELFLSFITKYGFSPTGEIHTKLISGFKWLGEATKPDSLEARFAKIAFSLETFIGGEASDSNISSRGISAMLAERAAFLVGHDYNSRYSTDRDIRNFYGKRSAIAHGRTSIITPSDFETFGNLVREVGWSLLERADKFSTINELQKWVGDLKYSVPEPKASP